MIAPITQSLNKREGHYGGRIMGINIRRWPQQRVDKLRSLASQPQDSK